MLNNNKKHVVNAKSKKVIFSLSELLPGDKGEIVRIASNDNNMLQKMAAMGIVPGTKVSLLQRFPSFLLQMCNSQFAVDKAIAGEIFVIT